MMVINLLDIKKVHAIVDCLNRVSMPTDEAWTFTALRERVLSQAPQNYPLGWLDLDSGILATNNKPVDWNTRKGHDWISTNGFDLIGLVGEPLLPMLTGFDMVIQPLPTNSWDSTTPADVVQSWALMQYEPMLNFTFAAKPAETDTFLFQTREGGKGILQILGVTGDRRGVKIRYKLAQNNGRER